ncbi:MFS transporter [Paenibacillus abyssi]|uniref:MFS-type transporter YfnC n=1 Tax=Paenibacillus abyssi TaxID=1340531 RepID=A0A917CW65_9BACL|nr:MFS transporter [Paenibacillus abyssi]GGF99721.1 putative MFS-type transporter YfnC [Paenibacillus abyssi]
MSNFKPTVFRVLIAISIVHLINDTMQAIIPAILPILKETMNLSYTQAGIIVFALNMTSSVMQPVVGMYADRKPAPYMLPIGMGLTTIGVFGIAIAPNYWAILLSVLFIGLGSAIFHPEASRVAYMAGGSRRGLAQSIFQVGGNSGSSLASIMTVLIFVPFGQFGAIWFVLITGCAIAVQLYVARWYQDYITTNPRPVRKSSDAKMPPGRKKQITFAIYLIIVLLFVRTWYNSSISIYYPFQLMEEFNFSLQQAQIYIFLFAAAGALGTFLGGPLSDRYGRRNVLFYSMVAAAPLALLLPYADPFWAYPIIALNGFIVMSGWSVTVVYAQELVPGKIGTVSGLTTGLAFGLGAIGAVAIGGLSDSLGLSLVMQLASYLPLFGFLAILLPSDQKLREWSAES